AVGRNNPWAAAYGTSNSSGQAWEGKSQRFIQDRRGEGPGQPWTTRLGPVLTAGTSSGNRAERRLRPHSTGLFSLPVPSVTALPLFGHASPEKAQGSAALDLSARLRRTDIKVNKGFKLPVRL